LSTAGTASSASSTENSTRSAAHRLWLGFALAATVLAYIGVVQFNFIFDDLVVIVNNPAIRSFSNLRWVFSHHLFATYAAAGNYYRPLNVAWFMLEYRLFGLAPAGWHVMSLAWHVIATLAVYFFGRRLTGDRATAALAALFFGLHPVHMEAVAWVSGPNDLMITALLIASFLAYARAREGGSRWKWVLSLALFAVALLVKEPAVVLPGFLAVYEWTRRDELADGILQRSRRTILAIAPHAALLAVYFVVRRLVLGLPVGGGTMSASILLTVPSVMALYVRHLIYPVGISVVYDTPIVTQPGWGNFFLPLLICLLAAGVLSYAARKSRAGLLAVAWFCFGMLPAFAVFRVMGELEEFARDRYLYLPSVGIFLSLAMAVRLLPENGEEWLGLPRAQSATALLLALTLAAATATQLLPWASDLLLFHHAIQTAPNSAIARIGLGVALRNRGEDGRAIGEFQEAYRLRPDFWTSNFYLGGAYFFAGRPAEAVPYLRRAIDINPASGLSQFLYLGRALTLLGQYDEAEDVMLRGKQLAEELQISAFFGPEQFDADLKEVARRRAAQQAHPNPN
jgi:protein O-mannosyl-transferase